MSFLCCNQLDEEETWLITLIVFLMSCVFSCFLALPHCAVGWSVVCDCGISLSYLLAFSK